MVLVGLFAFVPMINVHAEEDIYERNNFVTGNQAKVDSAKQLLEPLLYQVNNIKMDRIEIQTATTEEVGKCFAK